MLIFNIEEYPILLFNGINYAQTSKNVINLKKWSIYGNENKDVTKKINLAIEECSKKGLTLEIDSGLYLINTTNYESGLICRAGTTINFKKGAILKAIDSKSESYSVIRIFNCKNVNLINPTIVGDKERHLGKDGEWGHGITINNSENVTVSGATITECWGDGIYLGYDWNLKEFAYYNENINIVRPKISRCRRNGISICMGKYINIESPIITDINGTLPGAAIDFEPEFSDPNFNKLNFDKITVNNPITGNSHYGLLFALNLMRNYLVRIVVNNHIDNSSEYGCYFSEVEPGRDNSGSSIILNNPNWENNRQNGLCVANYSGHNSPQIIVNNPKIYNWNRANYKTFPGTAAISILNSKYGKIHYFVGNLVVNGGRYELSSKPVWYSNSYPVACSWGVPFENVRIQNIEFLKNVNSNIATPSEGIVIEDKYKYLKTAISTNIGKNNLINLSNFCLNYEVKSLGQTIFHFKQAPKGVPFVLENLGKGSLILVINIPLKYNGKLFTIKEGRLSTTSSDSYIKVCYENGNLELLEKKGRWMFNGKSF